MTRGFSSALTPNPAAESAPMRPRPSSLQPAGRWDASEEQVCACAFYLYTHHSCVLTAAAAPSLRPGTCTPAHPHTGTRAGSRCQLAFAKLGYLAEQDSEESGGQSQKGRAGHISCARGANALVNITCMRVCLRKEDEDRKHDGQCALNPRYMRRRVRVDAEVPRRINC